MSPTFFTMGGMIREAAIAYPDRPALSFGTQTLTFGELDERSSRVGRALQHELPAQGRVAFLDKNTPEFFDVVLGASKANVVTVPVNWRLSPPEIAHVVNDSGAEVVVVGAEFSAPLDLVMEQLPKVRRVLVLGEHPVHETFAKWVSAHPAEDPMAAVEDDDVFLQLYTSGTTGFPKGAMISNAPARGLVPLADEMGFGSETVFLMALPLFHTSCSVPLAVLTAGGHCVLQREFEVSDALSAIPRWQVTDAGFVPAMLQLLAAEPGAAEIDFSSLGHIMYGASPISESVLRASLDTFGCRFTQGYGLTETFGIIAVLKPEDHDPDYRPHLLRSMGKALPWVELRIVDPDSGVERAPGEPGELWTRSKQNMLGYLHQPEATAEAITSEGWLRTGDIGYRDQDGYVFLQDRLKDMIVSGAENVYPAEVENALMAHPGVADVAVVGVPDDRWGETVKAIVVKKRSDVTEFDLIAHARSLLAHYKCPTSVDFTEEPLPRNPSGKLLKRVIREPYWAGVNRRIQ